MQPLSADNRYRVYDRSHLRGQGQTPGRSQTARPTLRRDPAPSRWTYRMQRLWLTPLFRVAVRIGLPIVLVALISWAYLHDDARRAHITGVFTGMVDKFQNRPEFRVSLISVEGAAPELADAIRARLDLKLPQSSFDLDLDAARARIEALDAVAKADLRVRSGGVLEVMITERVPALVWRAPDRIEMLDATGARVAGLSARADRPDLPLIAGEGAERAAAEALDLFGVTAGIMPRVRGLVRVGERRWDLLLDRNQKIMLPEKNAVAALERLIALDKAEDVLARDVLTVDLRNEQRPVLRLAPAAMHERRQAQGIDTSGSEL